MFTTSCHSAQNLQDCNNQKISSTNLNKFQDLQERSEINLSNIIDETKKDNRTSLVRRCDEIESEEEYVQESELDKLFRHGPYVVDPQYITLQNCLFATVSAIIISAVFYGTHIYTLSNNYYLTTK